MNNLAVGVDFIYRKYDRGTTNYTVGYQPGAGYDALRAIYLPAVYNDALTGKSATYYYVCDGCSRPAGLGNITLTDPNYQIYKGVDLTMNKRFSNRWQAAVALTLQDNPNHFPDGTSTFINPTGQEFREARSTIARYLFKAQGSYTMPWDINVSANFNWNDGAAGHPTSGSATAVSVINGPGAVPGGTTGTISYGTLEYQPRGEERLKSFQLLDLGVQKVFRFNSGKQRLKLMLDGFNLFNENTILSYSSNLISNASYLAPASIVPPRVFRFGATIQF